MRTIDLTAVICLLASSTLSGCAAELDAGEADEAGEAGGSGDSANTDDPASGSDPGAGAAEPGHGALVPGGGALLLEELEAEDARAGAQVACQGTSSPFSTGPRCCPRTTVLRPWQRRCEWFGNLSPRRDSFGTYDGAGDRPNLLPVNSDTLQVCAAYVIDNAEGTGWPHGPYSNLYVDVFSTAEPLDRVPDGADRRLIGQARQLRGPHRTHDTTDEWNDDELQRYRNAGVFRWSGRSALVLRLWESDGSEDGAWGRRNDVLGLEPITRAGTLGGVWIAFHKYTNAHPRRRTAEVGGWLLLRTGGACPR